MIQKTFLFHILVVYLLAQSLKILKQISKSTITLDAKLQLDSILQQIVSIIILCSIQLLHTNEKLTLTTKELVNSIRLLFSDELMKNMLEEGDKSVKNIYTRKDLIIAPSFIHSCIKYHKFNE